MSNTQDSLDITGLLSSDTPARQKCKLGLRALSIPVAAVTLAFAVRFLHSVSGGDFFNQFVLSTAVLSMAWNIAEIALFFVNKRGFHPGAQVGAHLIVGSLVISSTVLYSLEYTFRKDRLSSYQRYHHKVYLQEYEAWKSNGPVVMATAGVLIALHFILFDWACVDVHKMRMKRHALLQEVLDEKRNAAAI